jgi:hypothetical protein
MLSQIAFFPHVNCYFAGGGHCKDPPPHAQESLPDDLMAHQLMELAFTPSTQGAD